MTQSDRPFADDPQDRLIARLVAEAPIDPIPADFAAWTAEIARGQAGRAPGPSMIEWGLWLLLAVTGTISLVAFAPALAAAARMLAAGEAAKALSWIVALAACAILTRALQRIAEIPALRTAWPSA